MKKTMTIGSLLCTAALLYSCSSLVGEKYEQPTDPEVTKATQEALKDWEESSVQLIPWTPLLHNINSADRKMKFAFRGDLPEAFEKYTIILTTSDSAKTIKQTLADGINTIVLPSDAKSGNLTVSIIKTDTSKLIYTEKFSFDVVDIPVVSTTAHKRLNNLVTEILNDTIDPQEDVQKFSFSTTRDGWVYIAAKNADAENLEVILDNDKTVINKDTQNSETFREVSIGEHTLSIKGAAKGGNIIVRSIAEIFNYCPMNNNLVRENKAFDWAFTMKYELPAVTTQNGGAVNENERKYMAENGYHWLTNQVSTGLTSNTDLAERLAENDCFKLNYSDGVTCDEQFFSGPEMLMKYTKGLKAFENPGNKLIYTWIVGKPKTPVVDQDFMATSVNVSKSRGKLIHEEYCRTKPTEEDAKAYLKTVVIDQMQSYKDCYPNVERNMGYIFGNFNQVPILSLQHHPEVDYKYFLDMQLNIVANDPTFKDIGCTGYWGSYYADHELHRWSFMLLRHYCVEGKTTMLSDEYGYSYLPGHSQNGDFSDGLNNWETKGNVTTGKKDGFASKSQNRWGGGDKQGDTFAILSNKEGEISSVSQKIVKLIPGKKYLVEFCTFDTDDVMAERIAPRRFALNSTISRDDATIDITDSWIHVDKREKGRYAHNMGARPNLHHIVFSPKKEEITITIDNEGSKPGENLGINFFRVMPYLPEED